MSNPPNNKKKHRCADCRHSERDTEGISFSTFDGHFFMGTCHRGHGYGKQHKVFMDHNDTICDDFEQ